MAKRRKPRPQKPDDVFSHGPLTMARYGSTTVFSSNWPAGAFEKAQQSQIELYPKVVAEIDTLVAEIAALVTSLPPEKLLHRAWWEMARQHLVVEAEVDIGTEQAVAMRMIDYVQSIITSVPRAEQQKEEVSEDDWARLSDKIERLFRKVTLDYQICCTAKNKADDPSFDMDFEEFRFKAEGYWVNVRGNRYQVHEQAYLADVFLPHSAILEELFGITGEQFVVEITKIWHALSFGLQDLMEDMARYRDDTMAALEKKIADLPPGAAPDMDTLPAEIIKENGWEKRSASIGGRFAGMDLFDVQKVTTLPQRLIDELSWSVGEETEFFAAGAFRGWPLRIWPVFKRPFIRLDGRSYCLDLYSLLDHIYRGMQRIIFRLKPGYKDAWNAIQQRQSEELPFKYLEKLLPGARVLRQVFYKGKTEAGKIDWCEVDGLLIYDDHLFVIEARGGAFTYTPPATDFPAYVASLKNLVLKPAMQGRRFLDYLKSAETVALYNGNHAQIGELSAKGFRRTTICPVTMDPFTELAAQVQHLRKIGVDVGSEPVWAISIDDLRVYSDIFENPLVFLHFVEQRMEAFKSDVIQSDDELDHLGLYLKHNHYSAHAKTLRDQSGARIGFHGYRSDVDKFFRERLFDPATPCPLKQEMPARLFEIVTHMTRLATPGRAEVVSYLLDLDGEWRGLLASGIDEELKAQPATRRPKPFSTHGKNVNLTVYCATQAWAPRSAASALKHARTVLLLNNDPRRLLLELSYTDAGVLSDLSWQWLTPTDIPADQLQGLRADAEKLAGTRITNAKAERRKIGRNEPCPCGSGKKYKKCHLQ